MTSSRQLRIAAVQAEPEWLNLEAAPGRARSCSHFLNVESRATPRGSDSPENRRSRPIDFDKSVAYIRNSLVYRSPEMERIRLCALENKINVVLGFSENDHGSLYIAQCILTDEGEIKAPRRKIKPTHMERTVFGDCTGDSLQNVVNTSIGRVGALSCWEHINPLLKYHTYHQRGLIHVAAWPPVHDHDGGPRLWRAAESALMNVPGGGSSAIYGPDGRKLTDDLQEAEEGLLVADVETDRVLETRCFVDPCDHYSRPDLLWLGVDPDAKKNVREGGKSD
ncbi:hypothetical protein FE257_004627 [Aspergillus nanangensis]|uniref:nitrilase n=1 Tax=Aspergillus nanangensis TaxID=2582783 RepID=A0AAD4H0S1_ASPNN|nr:hypothetical protein FE257_004627 [Aspergillus nanangensis]